MTHDENLIEGTIRALKQQRDELALKIHLGAAEAKQEFESAKNKLDDLSKDYDPLKRAVKESSDDVLTSLKLVSDEVRASFQRIRDALR